MKKIYCIPTLGQLQDFVQFADEYDAGFEYNDFFIPSVLDSPESVRKIIDAYKAVDRDRSEDTLHGVFLDMCVNSVDSLIFAATDRRIRQSMDIAVTLGIKAVIFHTNYIANFKLRSYREGWVNLNEKYWRKLLSDYPNLMVYLENMFDDDPELLRQLAWRMADEPRFAVCLDIAHAYLSSTSLSEWFDALSPYIRHLHINDNDKMEDSHEPVGGGTLPWEEYRSFIDGISEGKRPTVLVEVRNFENLRASVRYMKENHIYPL